MVKLDWVNNGPVSREQHAFVSVIVVLKWRERFCRSKPAGEQFDIQVRYLSEEELHAGEDVKRA